MKNVEIYTGPFCIFCDRAKALLNKKGVSFKEIKDLIKLCEQGPPLSRVDHVMVNEYNKNYLNKSFNVIKSD